MKIFQHSRFFFWWVSVLLLTTGIFWAYYFGVVSQIWEDDKTKITSLIAVIFLFTNIFLGYTAYKIADKNYIIINREAILKRLNGFWFISEQLMALGMLGTVIGLVYMLTSNFVGSDLQNNNAMQELLGNMWKSMGLALYANAVGLVASITLKIQIFAIGYGIDEA